MGVIKVKKIKCYAYHGCMGEEAKIGQHYFVDVVLTTDFSKAAAEDTLENTIDYVTVNKIVEEEMAIRSKLIEHVGLRIVNRMKETFDLESVEVTVIKPCPPINGDVESVAVVLQG